MSRCTIKRGFLTLRECGEPATGVCRTCGRPACAAHLVHDLTGALCAECSAERSSGNGPVGSDGWAPTDDWRYGYRDSYYRESGYRPQSAPEPAAGPRTDAFQTGGLAAGALAADGFTTGGTFDDLDREAFDTPVAEAGVGLDEDHGPSLFDS